MKRFEHLRLCQYSGRMVLDGWELHCGDVFQVKIDGQWRDTRIEHSDDWYLTGVSSEVELEGLEARSKE